MPFYREEARSDASRQHDPGLFAAGPDMPCRPQPGCIVQSARPHAAQAIRWQP
jgi:hypothetical protein